jgi:hypothetical protein
MAPSRPGADDGTVRAKLPRLLGVSIAVVLGAYLVGRGIAEFFVLDYSNPSSYGHDWGGPSLAGVLAVHSGPALVVIASVGTALWRRHRTGP